jgi:outer membrane receptor protein involved in Fe transport
MRWTTPVRALWVEYGFRWALRQDRLGTRDLTDPRIPEGGTPGYAVHGVRAAAELSPRLNVSVGFENLTDQLYRTHASGVDQAGRHVWVGVSVVGGI